MSGMEMSCLSRPLHYFGGYMIKRRENNWGNRNLRLNTLILYDFCFLVPAKPSKRHKAYLSMFPLILNVKQFDGAWSWQVVVQVVLALVCLCVLAMLLFTHHHHSVAIHHTYLNSMQEGRPKYTCLTCSWQRVGTASSCHHLGPPLQSPPIPASKPLPAASPQFASVPPFFASALARPRPVLCCGGAGTPVPYWLRGGWWFTRGLDPSPHHPRPLDLPTDQMQPPGLLHPKPKSRFLGHWFLWSSIWKMVWPWHWSDQQICKL